MASEAVLKPFPGQDKDIINKNVLQTKRTSLPATEMFLRKAYTVIFFNKDMA